MKDADIPTQVKRENPEPHESRNPIPHSIHTLGLVTAG